MHRLTLSPERPADPCAGQVRWSPRKSLWIGTMTAVGLTLAIPTASVGAVTVFVLGSALTLCAGHSVGIHRGLIHRSYRAPAPVRWVLAWLGTLVGMAGPLGLVRLHDVRDWAQRQPAAHDLFGHRRAWWQDYWWQVHCTLELERPPTITLEPELERDPVLRALEHTWRWQQLPVAALLWWWGGPGFVVWGVCLRVAAGVTGHWMVGHVVHRGGQQHWALTRAGVQGYNSRLWGALSFGEGWHHNHHAFPGSARMGLLPGEHDPGWWLLRALGRVGLVSEPRTPSWHACGRHPQAPSLPQTRSQLP